MKNQRNLSIILPLVVAIFTLVGCSDYDNGFTAKELHFTADFTREFGSFDPTQDWNLAERAYVTVTTSERKDVNVYTEKDGIYVQVGAFQNVSGTKKLEFDVIEDMQNLVVSDGDVALRAVVGGTVNFDDMSSVAGEEMETRGGEYMDRNLWKNNYVVPANITEAEWNAVVAEFSKQHYGAYNEVLVPWSEMFVQQVYKGEASYADAFNQGTGTASDKMNRLMIWDNAAPESSKLYDNSYLHVNDFNSGNQTTVAYDDHDTEQEEPIIGMTLMRGLDASNCPTEEVTVRDAGGNEVTKNWVKQFLYHNSQSSEYKATYIMKKVSWEEGGVTKSGVYLGFDFMADKPKGQPANLNMDVTRDWIFNDWIIKVSQGLDITVPVSKLQNAEPAAWILAGEDLGGGFDIDYNDVVVKVERVSGEDKVTVTPLAAGGTLASYLFFGKTCIGEIHQLLDASSARSGSYAPINLDGDLKVATQQVEVPVARDWGLSEDVSKANNMGGFTIRVLPAGTEPMAKVLNYDDLAFDKATDVNAPVEGVAPYILCVPFSYTKVNYPEVGQKMATVWAWPSERTYIEEPYPEFEAWVKDKNSHKDWFSKPSSKGFVSTLAFTRKVLGEQPKLMTEAEVEDAGNPTADVTFYNAVLPSVYQENKAPVAYLRLKEGVSDEIDVELNDVIDMLDYVDVTPDYRKSVFCESTSLGEMEPVAGSATQLKCVQTDHRTLVHIRIATPTGLLNVDVYVNSGSTGSDKPDANIWFSDTNFSVAAGSSKGVIVNGVTGNVSVRSVDSNVATATYNDGTLTITGVSAGTTQIILTQAETDDYKETDAYYNVTVTAATPPSVDEGHNVTPGGNGTMEIEHGKNYFFDIEYNANDDTYNVLYDKKEIKSHVSSITVKWSDYNANGGNIHICSPWRSFDYASGKASDSATVTKANLQELMTEEKRLLVICDNNPAIITIE